MKQARKAILSQIQLRIFILKFFLHYQKNYKAIPIRELTKNQWMLLKLIIIQQMKEGIQGFTYNPHSSFSAPFTIISQTRQLFTSKPISLPCLYEVYCPYTCKRIKVGLSKDNKVEALEFNTTTNRTVSFYANDNIRYLVNKHRPNKKDKKSITGQGWAYHIQVEDKGNVAIFNPYCVDPLQPLSFYTLQKIDTIDPPSEVLRFVPKIQKQALQIKIGRNPVYMSKNKKWIGLNKYFDEQTTQNITVVNPKNDQEQLTVKTSTLIKIVNGYLHHYYGQLQKIYQLQTKGIQFNQHFKLSKNIDEIYEEITFYLNILEQIRARFMNDSCYEGYKQYFKQHPRLYSSLQRLTSFLNYGNTKYDVIKLAQIGYFNRSDMLQDLAHVELPELQIPCFEQQAVKDQLQLTKKILPFSRFSQGLPFPNVDLNTSLKSMHSQLTTQGEIVKYSVLNPYITMVDNNAKLSLWSCEMMVYKMIDIDISADYQEKYLTICKSQADKKQALKQKALNQTANSQSASIKPVLVQATSQKQQEIKPDQNLLKQLQLMGYPASLSKKALIQAKNQQLDVVLDIIAQLSSAQAPNVKKPTKQWNCKLCTYRNGPNSSKCEMCGEYAPDQQQQLKAILEVQKKHQQQQRLKLQQQRIQRQKQQKQRIKKAQQQSIKKLHQQKRNRILKGTVKSIAIYRTQNNIDPFLISVLLQLQNSKNVIKTFRVGLSRKYLLKFYRIEDQFIISNFTRQVIYKKDFQEINRLIGNSRKQIQWGIKFFQSSSESAWTVISSTQTQISQQATDLRYQNQKLFVFNNQTCTSSYKISLTDSLETSKFSLQKQDQVSAFQQSSVQQQQISIQQVSRLQKSDKVDSQIVIDEKVQQVCIKVIESIQAGQWKNIPKNNQIKIPTTSIYAENLIMSQFLPLKIQSFQGSIFSNKYSCNSMLEKSNDKNNIYVSNYPNVSFVFKLIDNKPMFVQTVTVVSKNIKMNKIYPISSGLIFTANQLSWFTVAKQKFANYSKQQYESWLKYKQVTGQTVAFWEPVAYFDILNQAQFQINFKRVAKYVFLLPTSANKKQVNDDVIAVKIDFFGVKGRVEEEISDFSLYEQYKNQGTTQCSLELQQLNQNRDWHTISQGQSIVESAVSANTLNFAPKHFYSYSQQIPLNATSIFKIKFKNLTSQKKILVKSKNIKSISILSTKQATNNVQKLQITSFAELATVHSKLSNNEIEKILNQLNLNDLIFYILEGPADISNYQNMLNKILTIPGYDKLVLKVLSETIVKICDLNIKVSEVGFKSIIRFYEKVLCLDQKLSKQSIQRAWIQVIQFCQKVRNRNYNILRNSYKIEQLVLQPGLFSKDYYRLIHPNYVYEQKPLSIAAQPQTPINNRVFIDFITNFNYIYYIDLLGHQNISSLQLYFPKITNDARYKITLKIAQFTQQDGQLKQKQIYYRYFHEDYLLQLSQKAYRDTQIFTKTQINYCSIPGQLISSKTRILKMYFNLSIVTMLPNPKYKPLNDPYIILPIITSNNKTISTLSTYTQNPLSPNLSKLLNDFPTATKHNSLQQRMPPHKYAHDNKKFIYCVHELKNKSSSVQVKAQSMNKIQKIVQNILDKNIVNQTVSTIKVNDYVMGYKGLDFAYTFVIVLYKMFRKLNTDFKVDVKLMFMLFDAFIVHQCGPIKNQTVGLLTQLYNRLSPYEKNTFVSTIIDNYLIDTQKIRNLKISQKYPSQKIIKFLGQLNLPVATLFQKLRSLTSIASITILILLITNNNNKSTNLYENLDVYSQNSNEVVQKMEISQLIKITYQVCNWVIVNSSSLSSEILQLGLNLLLGFLTQKSGKISAAEIKKFVQNLEQKDFWQLVFGTIRKRNQLLNDKIDTIFKVLVENITDNFQKGINNMLLQIIKKDQKSLYESINPNVDDDARMGHLKTILEYLSLTNKKIFLDSDTATSLLQLPLTTTLWSLALKIIPRQDKILIQIIKKFPQEHYNSLGTQLMQFCEPLAGIKRMQSNHINWLDLVRKIRLEGRSLFQLFIQKLKVCNFGGRYGLTMALAQDVIRLQVAEQFSKLIAQNKIEQKSFTQQNIDILVSWFFMNYTKQKGVSPATDILVNLSKNVLTIFQKITGTPSIIPKFMKKVLQVKKQGQIVQNLFEQKRISSSNAIQLNKRFSECFELLINLLCVNDQMFNYFAFDIDGLKYVLEKAGLQSQTKTSRVKTMKSLQGQAVTVTIPQQQYLISQGLITSSAKDSAQAADKSSSQIQLKQEEIATNVQLVPNKNAHSITTTITDWTVYKKANKTKIIFLPMNGVTYHEFPLYITFAQACQVRSIKIGFPAASYEFTDKLVASPSCVVLEGGMDLKNMESMGQMQKIDDEGYTCNGVRVFVLNLQKTGKNKLKINQAIQSLPCFRIKYLKIIVKRPVVSFIQGQYSPLNGKPYTNLGSSISFLSILGDNFQKRKLSLLNFCKQISKSSALTILGTVINQTNQQTVKKISHSQQFVTNFKNKFNVIQQHMVNYPNIVPNIVYSLGANNQQLGDWIINKFLSEGNSDVQAKLLNQIVVSSAKRIYIRLDIFLTHILNKIKQIVTESDIQANIKYSESLFFIQSFCKTLQESYDFNIQVPTTLHCTLENIDHIITLYDKKYSSPEIKTFSRLLINLLYLHEPLKLSEQVLQQTLNLIWKNCSEAKPYYYDLLGTLLVNKKCKKWVQQNNHQKIKSLTESITKSISSNSQKILNPQLFLLWILSFHEKQYILQQKIYLQIYNKVKLLTVSSFEIYDNLIKLIQNVLLDSPQSQKQMAIQLIQDVDLLVQRRDQNLQQLYVGILRLQKQINVNIKGFDVDSRTNKKDSLLSSSILNKAHIKLLSQKINKKIKFNLILQANEGLKTTYYDKVYSAINASQFLMVIKLKLTNGKLGYIGCYSPGKAFRTEEQDSYCWEDVLNYQKGSFIFYVNQGQTKFIQSTQNTQHMLSLFGGDDQMDESISLYDKNVQILKLPFSSSVETTFNFPIFAGAKIQSIQIFNGIIRPSTMQPKLLASSSKAPIPFNYYRTSSIYVFPARITIDKFMNIIGIKGKCRRISKKLNSEEVLGNIIQQTNDFIADISIQVQQSQESGKQDEGYFPIMKIFDKFSELDGVNKVLQIGSKSIKDWRKPERRKCFEHYMSQLKNFVDLPSFFNHYIKNQQSITFLFEVASGLPDDPNSEKNWQQEQVKSSKFIYKILADIYKYDKSPQIRDMKKYSLFCQLILQKLAQISKQTVRSCKQTGSQSPQINKQTKQAEKEKSSGATNVQKKKKKGIGYSSDNQNTSKWTASQWIQYRKNMNEQIQRVASIFVSFLDSQTPLTDVKLAEIIKNSCLLPLIESALRSGSLLDISKQADLFRSYLNIIKSLAANPATVSCLLQIDSKYKPSQTQSIFKLLTKLHGIAQIFIDCLKSGKANQQNQVAAIIATEIEKVYYIVDKAVKNLSKATNVISIKQINSMPTAEAYRLLLGGLRFGYVDMKKKQDYSHFYSSTIPKGSPPTAKILRLSQELADLSSSLPCQHTNSIFVRCDKSRIDVIKILIMGSKDTPYSNGAFMFDLFCDDSYPNNPPKMSITTTGNGKIRFNPNLYSCGKVCLSLLGTWRGQASQNWDPKISTLLQLFISTQGITMSEDLYFNQPGFDSQQGTVQGDKKNQAYSNIVKVGNVRYAMIQQIKNPPKGFEDVVNRHFYVKRKQILQEIQKWIELADKKQASYVGLVNDHNTTWCSQLKAKGKYKQLLVKQYQQLKTILQKLPEPNLVQPQEQAAVIQTQKVKKKVKAKQVKLGQIDVSYEPQGEKELQIQQNVMQDRWSRYIGAMGIQAVKKQAESKVILVGLKPLGLQIAKNLVLSGLKQLCIVDHGIYQNGSSQHFYMSDIKSNKIQDCIYKIKQLNPYMLVKCAKQIPALQGYHLVISTQNLEQAKVLSAKCRKQKVKFIHAQTSGVSGLYFADLGEQFIVQDKNGEQHFEGLIKQISINQNGVGVVKLLDGIKHPYQDGDFVVLDKVQGMKQIQSKMQQPSAAQVFYNKMSKTQNTNTINGKVFQIKVINWNSFEIGDIKNYQAYVKGGLCKNINIPHKLQYKPLEECVNQFDKFLDPSVGIYDFEKMSDNYAIFACFTAYSEFILKNKRKPKNWSLQDSEQFQAILKKLLEHAKKSQQQTQQIIKFGRKYSLVAEAQIPVIGAYFGGLVSQQIIKAITNKYTPIKQFFTFHFNQLMQQIPEDTNKFKDLQVKQDENFSNLKIVVGRQNSKKIQKMKTFVIGAGAIGCELLKNFAMVNMGAEGMITITDPDHIQTSNLTRQFLFRQKHVKKPKSATAAATLIQMNPLLKNHISARLDRVSQQTQQIYSDEFFESQTVVANALDNVKARVYVDLRCVINSKPLFESGTLGPKGHVQVIVPQQTQNYGNQNDPTEQNQIPHCTLKMFPEQTVHCIQWSRDIFGKVFTLNPKALKKVIQAKDILVAEGQQKSTISKMIQYKPDNFDDCVGEAVRKFYKYFRNNVRQLLHTYPIDMKTKDGNLFWTLPKRPPKQINQIDFTDAIQQKFIVSYAILLAKIYNLPFPKNFRQKQGIQSIMSIAKGVKVEQFVPNEEQSQKLQKMTQKQQKSNVMEEKQTQQKVPEPKQEEPSMKLELTKQILQLEIKPEEFQKDEDSNGHIDLIYSMSNLRARNYGLNQCTWIQAKLKAGKIMAALSTTTSVVAALQTIQIVKLVIGSKQYRNAFVNLAIPLIQISEPGAAPKHKCGNTQFSVWDTWEFKAESLKDLLKQLSDKYDVEGYNISTAGGVPVYWQKMYVGKQAAAEQLLNRPLNKIFQQKTALNILMRSKQGDKKPYQHVPRLIVEPKPSNQSAS